MSSFQEQAKLELAWFFISIWFLVVGLDTSQGYSTGAASNQGGHGSGGGAGGGRQQNTEQNPLLVVVIDGLRWDYLHRFKLRSRKPFSGFDTFLEGGVRTEYLKSVFPSESFPAWQTISTGVYPGNHGIIGNEFYDKTLKKPNRKKVFFYHDDSRKTDEIKWWSTREPIWATATKQGLKFANILFSRCDKPWNDSKTYRPHICESVYLKDNSHTLASNMEMATIYFQTKGVNAAIVYEDGLGRTAEEYGPLSRKTEQQLRLLDRHIKTFLKRLDEVQMKELVNIVIVSDHGMTYGSQPMESNHPRNFQVDRFDIKKVQLGNVLDSVKSEVDMVVGSGAYSMVYPKNEMYTNSIVSKLRLSLRGIDVKVYKRDEIPEHLHWSEDVNIPPILLLAQNGTVILRAPSNLQRPGIHQSGSYGYDKSRLLEQTKQGISGYDPEERDMRGVFMARGPAFVDKATPQPPIELVDLYQMFCFILGIEPAPNDGIWERIKGLLRNSSSSLKAANILVLALTAVVTTKFF